MQDLTSEKIWQRIQKGPFLVAEIGKNFIQTEEEKSIEEYLKKAKELVKAAKLAGTSAVKFQTHHLEDEQLPVKITSPHFSSQERYQWVKRNTESTPLEFWFGLKEYCDRLGIIFFSTPMSRGAAIKLEKVGVPLWKVGSADILDFVMLDFIARTQKPIIISSGMSTLAEIDKAVNFLKSRTNKIVLLHCVSKYPCPPQDLNLATIEFLKKRYGLLVGFSDHSIDLDSAVVAAKMGAVVIEKHFSLSRDLWGPDHKVSLMPEEFKKMARAIRKGKDVSLTDYGQARKFLQKDEASFRPIFRKALVAGRDIESGSVLTGEMIYAMRPQVHTEGLPSEEYENVLAKRIKKPLKKYQPITWQNLE